MAVAKVLGRDFSLYINTGTDVAPVWTKISGIETLTFSSSKNDVDITDFDSAGWKEHMVVSRSRNLSVEGFYLVDPDTGTRDVGQEAVEAAAVLMGADSLSQYKLVYPSGSAKTFHASANMKDVGGSKDDTASWGVDLTVSGQLADAV